MKLSRLYVLLLPLYTAGLLSSCTSPDSGVAAGSERAYTGRRWFIHPPRATHFCWGYVKKPGQSWHRARLVIMDERAGISPPDRPADSTGTPRPGDDHNCEYNIVGRFTGHTAYDPNSDLVLPLFAARSFTLVSSNPRPLPGVGSPAGNEFVPAREAPGQTPARMRR